jgi:hypothetical protein
MLLPRLPSCTVTRFSSGIWSESSPVTVAGTAPDFRRLPYYPRSRADLVRVAGLGGFWLEGKGRQDDAFNAAFCPGAACPKIGGLRALANYV